MTVLTTIVAPTDVDANYPRTSAFNLVNEFHALHMIEDAAVLIDFRVPESIDIAFLESLVDYTAELQPERLIVLGIEDAVWSTLKLSHDLSAMHLLEVADDLVGEDPETSPLDPSLFEQFMLCEIA